MLKQRLITALALIPLVLWLLFTSWMLPYQMLVALVLFLGLREWVSLLGGNRSLILLISLFAISVLFFLHTPFAFSEIILLNIAFLGCLLFMGAVLEIWLYPKTWLFQNRVIAMGYGTVLITVFAYLLVAIKSIQPVCYFLLSVLLLTWASDTGAYFAGRRFGKRKMAPQISPKKTIAGFWGGALLTIIVAFLLALGGILPVSLKMSPIFAMVLHLAAVSGDLFESILKRHVNVKDSGQLLPGHGGMLDRIDSLLATLPVSVALSFILIRI